MRKDLRNYAGKAPPHLCADGHEPIGCWDVESEQCPVCILRNATGELAGALRDVLAGKPVRNADELVARYAGTE